MNNNSEILYNYLNNLISTDNVDKLYTLKKNALQNIKNSGLPANNNEQWKYIDIGKYINQIIENNTLSTAKASQNEHIGLDLSKAYVIFLDSGNIINEAYKHINSLNISADLAYINTSSTSKDDFISTLNEASISNIINIEITDTIEKPIYIIHTFNTDSKIVSYKININIAKGIKNCITELFLDETNNDKIIIYDTHITLEAKSSLDSYRFNNIKSPVVFLSNLNCAINKEAKFNNINISASNSAKLIKNHINCHLNEELASTELYGLNLLKNADVVDNQTAVFHNVSNCTSDELYKYINTDNATGIFNGKIYVAKDAQQTQAFQQNKNILLSENAKIHARPQLEIFANDVKCSHGCTIGQLDEKSIFYLITRGLSEQEAKNMLINSFALEILDKLHDNELKSCIHSKICL